MKPRIVSKHGKLILELDEQNGGNSTNVIKAIGLGAIFLAGLTAWAQEFPRVEVGADYSYLRFAPSGPYTKGHSLNGGGGSLTITGMNT